MVPASQRHQRISRTDRGSRSRNLRVPEVTHRQLRTITDLEGLTLTGSLVKAVDWYGRYSLLEAASQEWERALRVPEVRAEVAAKDAELDGTLLDGFEAEESW
jgi:hypothetical protein